MNFMETAFNPHSNFNGGPTGAVWVIAVIWLNFNYGRIPAAVVESLRRSLCNKRIQLHELRAAIVSCPDELNIEFWERVYGTATVSGKRVW